VELGGCTFCLLVHPEDEALRNKLGRPLATNLMGRMHPKGAFHSVNDFCSGYFKCRISSWQESTLFWTINYLCIGGKAN